MHFLNQKLNEIDRITSDFQKEFGELSMAQLNWKPTSSVWSIAQNIDHLIVINSTYFPVVEAIRNGSYRLPWVARIPFLVRLFGRFILKGVNPDRKARIKTFPVWQPAASELPGDILIRFEKHQRALADFMRNCEDLVKNGQVISSPANRNIVYSLDTAFEIIVTHERRHLEQAREVKSMKEFPA